MPQLEKNHYVQNRLLKNFATKKDNGKYKICVMNLLYFNAEYRNTESAFYEKNLYDVEYNEDIKILEKKFGDKIEIPMTIILEKFENEQNNFLFYRNELETIKKYLLLQIYRTPHNLISYSNPPQNAFELSQFNINENETRENFWKREMLTILDNSWDSLVQSEMIGISKHAMHINSSFILIVRTKEEFCINDLGCVTERIPIRIPKENEEEYIAAAKKLGIQLYGQDNFDEATRREIVEQKSYIDNFIMFPITSEYAILLVDPIWKMFYLHPEIISIGIPLFSRILFKHFSLPVNKYVNKDKIKTDADILKYKDEKDEYTYHIHDLTTQETIYLNHLLMNEAHFYIGLKTPKKFLSTVREYNILKANGESNVRKDLNGFVELLSKL